MLIRYERLPSADFRLVKQTHDISGPCFLSGAVAASAGFAGARGAAGMQVMFTT